MPVDASSSPTTAAAAAAIADAVLRDMAASDDIDTQRAMTGLGDLLRQPFPLRGSTLAPHLMPPHGGCAAYSAALGPDNTNAAGKRRMVALAQTAGGGKTHTGAR